MQDQQPWHMLGESGAIRALVLVGGFRASELQVFRALDTMHTRARARPAAMAHAWRVGGHPRSGVRGVKAPTRPSRSHASQSTSGPADPSFRTAS
eukprot:4681209-Pyramimonas_sp.AAC.1